MPLFPGLAPWVANFNADPTDWQRLLAFADFLIETADAHPKLAAIAPGFHALGHHRRAPWWASQSEVWGFRERWVFRDVPEGFSCELPSFWIQKVQHNRHIAGSHYFVETRNPKPKNQGGFMLLKAAARAFCGMREDYRAQIMSWAPGKWGRLSH